MQAHTVIVSNFAADATRSRIDRSLKALFGRYGPVINCITEKNHNKQTVESAKIQMQYHEDAKFALEKLNGSDFLGSKITVEWPPDLPEDKNSLSSRNSIDSDHASISFEGTHGPASNESDQVTMAVEAEIEINDVPAASRNVLISRSTIDEIKYISKALVEVKGRYLTPQEQADPNIRDQPLTILIKARDKASIDSAIGKIQEYISKCSGSGKFIEDSQPKSTTSQHSDGYRQPLPAQSDQSSARFQEPPRPRSTSQTEPRYQREGVMPTGVTSRSNKHAGVTVASTVTLSGQANVSPQGVLPMESSIPSKESLSVASNLPPRAGLPGQSNRLQRGPLPMQSSIPPRIPLPQHSNIPTQANIPPRGYVPMTFQSNIPPRIPLPQQSIITMQAKIPPKRSVPMTFKSNIPPRIPLPPQYNIPTQANIPFRASVPMTIQSNIPTRVRLPQHSNIQPNGNLQSNLPPNSMFSPMQNNIPTRISLPIQAYTPQQGEFPNNTNMPPREYLPLPGNIHPNIPPTGALPGMSNIRTRNGIPSNIEPSTVQMPFGQPHRPHMINVPTPSQQATMLHFHPFQPIQNLPGTNIVPYSASVQSMSRPNIVQSSASVQNMPGANNIPSAAIQNMQGPNIIPSAAVQIMQGPNIIPSAAVQNMPGPDIPSAAVQNMPGPNIVPSAAVQNMPDPNIIPSAAVQNRPGPNIIPSAAVQNRPGPNSNIIQSAAVQNMPGPNIVPSAAVQNRPGPNIIPSSASLPLVQSNTLPKHSSIKPAVRPVDSTVQPPMHPQQPDDNKKRPETIVEADISIGLGYVPAKFNLKERLVGPRNFKLNHIQKKTGALMTVHGIQSGWIDSKSGVEEQVPLYIHVTCPEKRLMETKERLHDLIQTVRGQYEDFKKVEESKITPETVINDYNHVSSTQSAEEIKFESKTKHCVHMCNVPFDATVEDILKFFEPLGPTSVAFEYDKDDKPKGIAHADFDTHGEVIAAMKLHNKEIGNRNIKLKYDSIQDSKTYLDEKTQQKNLKRNITVATTETKGDVYSPVPEKHARKASDTSQDRIHKPRHRSRPGNDIEHYSDMRNRHNEDTRKHSRERDYKKDSRYQHKEDSIKHSRERDSKIDSRNQHKEDTLKHSRERDSKIDSRNQHKEDTRKHSRERDSKIDSRNQHKEDTRKHSRERDSKIDSRNQHKEDTRKHSRERDSKIDYKNQHKEDTRKYSRERDSKIDYKNQHKEDTRKYSRERDSKIDSRNQHIKEDTRKYSRERDSKTNSRNQHINEDIRKHSRERDSKTDRDSRKKYEQERSDDSRRSSRETSSKNPGYKDDYHDVDLRSKSHGESVSLHRSRDYDKESNTERDSYRERSPHSSSLSYKDYPKDKRPRKSLSTDRKHIDTYKGYDEKSHSKRTVSMKRSSESSYSKDYKYNKSDNSDREISQEISNNQESYSDPFSNTQDPFSSIQSQLGSDLKTSASDTDHRHHNYDQDSDLRNFAQPESSSYSDLRSFAQPESSSSLFREESSGLDDFQSTSGYKDIGYLSEETNPNRLSNSQSSLIYDNENASQLLSIPSYNDHDYRNESTVSPKTAIDAYQDSISKVKTMFQSLSSYMKSAVNEEADSKRGSHAERSSAYGYHDYKPHPEESSSQSDSCYRGSGSRDEYHFTETEMETMEDKTLPVDCKPSAKKKKTRQRCPCRGCKAQSQHIRRHVFLNHLPEFMSEEPINIDSMVNLITVIAQCFGVHSIEDLPKFVTERGWYPQGWSVYHAIHVPEVDIEIYRNASLRAIGNEGPEVLKFCPPNCVASLFHWRAFAVMLENIPKDKLVYLPKLANGDVKGKGIDAHCYLMEVMGALQVYTAKDAFDKMQKKNRLPLKIQSIVAIFCFPERFSLINSVINDAASSNVYCCFGIHPRAVSTASRRDFEDLQHYLSFASCVGVGDIGFDYSLENFSKTEQENAFIRMLLMAVGRNLPVVIHCRNELNYNGNVDAYLDALRVCEKLLAGSENQIYLHGYDGSLKTALKWIQSFPEVMFGFTPELVKGHKREDIHKVIKQLSIDNILLESDSPFERYAKDENITPGDIYHVAHEVAKLHGCNALYVVNQAARNAISFFRL